MVPQASSAPHVENTIPPQSLSAPLIKMAVSPQPSYVPLVKTAVSPQHPSAPLVKTAVPPQPPSVPTMQSPPADLSTDAWTVTKIATVLNVTMPLPNPTGVPSSMAVPLRLPPNYPGPHDERLGYGDWSEQPQQVGGGYPLHVFHAPQALGQFFPYHGNEAGMISPPRGLVDSMQHVMYFDTAGAYHNSMYRGDP